MKFIFRGTVLFWCITSILAQWDCVSLLNRGEYYGNASDYCDNYDCGLSCVGTENVGIVPENFCAITEDEFFPTCVDEYGETWTCDVPPCNDHAGCYSPSTNGTDYRGLASYTENGYRCIRWNDVILESWNVSMYPNTEFENNYCRNPNNRERPWCFYMDRNGESEWSYCHIPACNSTILSEFTRIPNLYNSELPVSPGNNWESTFLDEYTLDMEEKCARLCLEEKSFTCRQFHLAIGPRYCEWLEYGEYHRGSRVEYRYDTAGDVFIRKYTYCDGFNVAAIQNACTLPLGMESSWIPDADILASSFLDEDHAPHFARLHGDSSWIPHPSDRNPVIQITFPERMVVSGLLIQGGGEADNLYTSTFYVTFRVAGYDRFIYYQRSLDDDDIQFFGGNAESTCVLQVFFERPIRTHEIQVWPYVRDGPVALRIEFFGCRDNGCDESIAKSIGSTPFDRIEASSFQDLDHTSSIFRLNPFVRGETGWIPGPESIDPNPWLQVTFFSGHNIAGIMSRKCGSEIVGLGWLTRFDLSWALTGYTTLDAGKYETLNDLSLNYTGGGSLARLYLENMLYDTQVVRINPTDWGGAYRCITMDLMGCDHSEYSTSLDDPDHDRLIANVTCMGCNTDTLSQWHLHQHAADASSGIEFAKQTEQWVQIEFNSIFIVSGLVIQGGTERNFSFLSDLEGQIDEYTITYQTNFEDYEYGYWRNYVDITGYHVVFSGLRDPFGETINHFDRPFMAVRLRIHLRQNEDTYKGRVRFRVRGSQLTDITQICGAREILYNGYCIGVIETEADGMCNDVFLPGSYPLAIKSEDIQNLLLANRERLPLASGLVIGLRSDMNGIYRWPDGTPVLYNNFGPNPVTSIGKEQCAFINFYNCFEWELYDCVPSQRSTVCQADLNECLAPQQDCAQTCVNDFGGYHCTCDDGYRLEGQSDCEDVCINSFDLGYQTWVSTGSGACMYPTLWKGTNEEARNTCELLYGRLPTPSEVIRLQDVFNITENLLWVEPHDASLDSAIMGVTPDCYAVNASRAGNVSAWMTSCNETLEYSCIKSVSNTRIQDLFDEGVEDFTLNVSYGYIELRAFSPWYYTERKMSIFISGPPKMNLRLDIIYMDLRTFINSNQGNGCMDSLAIYDPMGNSFREICGRLPPFRIIMPSHIILDLTIGPLQATMKPLGFSIYYESVDCSRDQCVTGCGESTLVYQDGVLETAPFPSTFSPFSECSVRISAPPDKYIAIHFTDYRINVGANGDQCTDSLGILSDEWDTPIERQCEGFPPLFITNTNEVDVRLVLGLEKISEGFQANVTFIDKPGCFESSLDQCSSTFYECDGSSGIIISPNYPMLTVDVKECRWHITTPENSYVRLRFTDFFFSFDCPDHSVTIYEQNADGLTNVQLDTFCRENPPMELLESNLNSVTIALDNVKEDYGIRMMIEYEAAFFGKPYSNDSDTEHPCPPSTATSQGHWDHVNGSCYQFVRYPERLHWRAAEDHCQSIAENSHLVSIRSRDEAILIHYMMTSHWHLNESDTYIGLGNRNYRGIFRWTDGSPMTYTDWYIPPFTSDSESIRPLNEPDGGGLDACVQIVMTSIRSTALWHAIPCLARSGSQFICKVPAVSHNIGISQTTSVELDFRNPSNIPECLATMITCGTGECVHSVYTCDRRSDCADGTDERNCLEDVRCSSTSYTCNNDECIPMSFYCDNVTHCEDGSDELDCAPYNCNTGEFRCDNGRCIAYWLKCDLVDHCFDNSDEMYCRSGSGNMFTCYNGDEHPLSVRCDGIVDCIGSSAEDELELCEYRRLNHNCDDKEIECSNGVCVDTGSQCIYDIKPSQYINGCRDVSHLRSCGDFQCPDYSMKCPGSYCIPLRFRCNGVWDCANGEDELECDRFVCPPGTYSCRSCSICIPLVEVCDGIRHCPDADDEQFCGVSCPHGCNCTGLVFVCGLPDIEENPSFIFSVTAKKIVITSAPLILTSNNATTDQIIPVSGDKDEDHVTYYTPFRPSDYPFLAELELVDTDIKTIPASIFTQNQDLYYLSLRQNPIEMIELGAFTNLTKLRVLDIRESSIPSNEAIRKALQQIPSLHTVYADSFAFCCMLDLIPADEFAITGCFAPIDQFSSCDDLLKDNTLRVFMWILGMSALAGNLCTIGLRVFGRKSVSSTRIQAKLITHLAVSDLLMGIYMLIIAIADQYFMGDYAIHADRWRGSVVCRVAGFMSALSSEVSVFIVMLISIDRILCIVFSQHHHVQLSNKSSTVWLAIVWVTALVLALVPAFSLEYFGQFYGRSSVCLGLPLSADRPPGWEYSLSIFLGLNLVCFIVTAFCYVAIFVTVHRSARNFANAKDGGRHVKNGASIQVKLATRMAVIVGTDFICWMPIIIMGFLTTSGAIEIPAEVYAWTAVFILPLNSSLNPYLYTISTIWQHRKAKQRQKSLRESEGTQLSVSAAVAVLPERGHIPRAIQEKYTHLTSQCILTPYNAPTINMTVVPLSKYIEDRGQPPSVVDSSLILRDVRKAISYLNSKSVTKFKVTEDQIALQLNSNNEIVRAFLMNSDAALLKTLSIPQSERKENLHSDFMATFMDNIKDLETADDAPVQNGQRFRKKSDLVQLIGDQQ